MLYFTFSSISQAALIFTAIPLSAIGGIWALELRGMPFSISAGIGFIALFGVAVLNGIVLIGYFNQLKKEGMTDLKERILIGTKVRLRPVLMTAAVASLGFLPMAISSSGGAEVQRPLATVVIGGLLTATFLTLVILPILYYWLESWTIRKNNIPTTAIVVGLMLLGFTSNSFSQTKTLSLDSAINMALKNHPDIKAANLEIERNEALKMKYSLGKTDVSYQGDGLVDKDFGQQVNQIGIVQNIPNPSVTKSANKLQEQMITKSTLSKQIAINELKWKVKNLYYEIQYKQELATLYSSLTETYLKNYNRAKVRVETGETNQIELLSLQSKWNEFNVLFKQNEIELSILYQQFELLLNSSTSVTGVDSIYKENYVPNMPLDSNIYLKINDQNSAIETAKIKVLKADLKPDFNIGYAAQNYYSGGWYSGAQAGVSFNIFRGQTKRKIVAQQIQVKVINELNQSKKLELKQKIAKAEASIHLYEEGVKIYKKQIEDINPKMIQIAQLNYEAGEISYLELLNTLQLVATNNSNYWNQIMSYNKAVADYQLINNQ